MTAPDKAYERRCPVTARIRPHKWIPRIADLAEGSESVCECGARLRRVPGGNLEVLTDGAWVAKDRAPCSRCERPETTAEEREARRHHYEARARTARVNWSRLDEYWRRRDAQ